MQDFKKMSEEYQFLLAEERAKSERDYLARILAKKKVKTALSPREPADSQPPSQSSAILTTSSIVQKILDTAAAIAELTRRV